MGLPETCCTYASSRYLIGDNLAGRKRLLLDQLCVQLEGLGLGWGGRDRPPGRIRTQEVRGHVPEPVRYRGLKDPPFQLIGGEGEYASLCTCGGWAGKQKCGRFIPVRVTLYDYMGKRRITSTTCISETLPNTRMTDI